MTYWNMEGINRLKNKDFVLIESDKDKELVKIIKASATVLDVRTPGQPNELYNYGTVSFGYARFNWKEDFSNCGAINLSSLSGAWGGSDSPPLTDFILRNFMKYNGYAVAQWSAEAPIFKRYLDLQTGWKELMTVPSARNHTTNKITYGGLYVKPNMNIKGVHR